MIAAFRKDWISYLSDIVAISFIDGGNQGKPPICGM